MSAVASPPSSSLASANSPASACPVDHSKLSQEQWEQWSRQRTTHPHTQHPQPTITTTPQQPSAALHTSAPLACDSSTFGSNTPSPPSSSASAFHIVGDIFPDSKPSPTQRLPLSSLPVASSIPRAGIDPSTQVPHTVWTFPSPQRFYNAMTRKGWRADERDMVHVVSIHNTVNEHTWQAVHSMERRLHPECSDVRLGRFRGRPNDLSVKARLKGLVGYERPFDRHDWVVDRCGKEVRYVIDFYAGQESEMGSGHAAAVHIDARPAVDDVEGLYDRLRLAIREWW